MFNKKQWAEWAAQKLRKHGFIPKEEFEVQTQVLMRTRQKIEHLERRISTLEAQLNHSSNP